MLFKVLNLLLYAKFEITVSYLKRSAVADKWVYGNEIMGKVIDVKTFLLTVVQKNFLKIQKKLNKESTPQLFCRIFVYNKFLFTFHMYIN